MERVSIDDLSKQINIKYTKIFLEQNNIINLSPIETYTEENMNIYKVKSPDFGFIPFSYIPSSTHIIQNTIMENIPVIDSFIQSELDLLCETDLNLVNRHVHLLSSLHHDRLAPIEPPGSIKNAFNQTLSIFSLPFDKTIKSSPKVWRECWSENRKICDLSLQQPLSNQLLLDYYELIYIRSRELRIKLLLSINYTEALLYKISSSISNKPIEKYNLRIEKDIFIVETEQKTRIIFDNTFREYNKIYENIVKLCSYYLNKYINKTSKMRSDKEYEDDFLKMFIGEQINITANEFAEGRDTEVVDRQKMVFDVLQCELHYMMSKIQLLTTYYDLYCHSIEKKNKDSFYKTFINIYYNRPLFDVKSEYFIDSYTENIIELETQRNLLKMITKTVVKNCRDVSCDFDGSFIFPCTSSEDIVPSLSYVHSGIEFEYFENFLSLELLSYFDQNYHNLAEQFTGYNNLYNPIHFIRISCITLRLFQKVWNVDESVQLQDQVSSHKYQVGFEHIFSKYSGYCFRMHQQKRR